MTTSRIKGFHDLGVDGRRDAVLGDLSIDQRDVLCTGGLSIEEAAALVEDVVGLFGLPLALAPNFLVDGIDQFLPMVTEEPSVVAAAANGARVARLGGGFTVTAGAPVSTCQLLIEPTDLDTAHDQIDHLTPSLLEAAAALDPVLSRLGGGPLNLEVGSRLPDGALTLLLHVNCLDAMGANVVNTMGEHILDLLEEAGVGRGLAAIVTNAMPHRKTTVTARFPVSALLRGGHSGEDAAEGILALARWAAADPFRAVTHNKGIMNGVTAVTLATGNDTRAQEAAAHWYASRSGSYGPLSSWSLDGDALVGTLALPVPAGTVGGLTAVHRTTRLLLSTLGITDAATLAALTASAGLANNFAALWAIATEGIQRGHMTLHARRLK